MSKHESPAAAPGAKRRVFLVDDHPIVREWLTVIINGQIDQLVSGQRADAPSPLAEVAILRPDVDIVDLTSNLKTVQGYCARIKEKLGFRNATELLREAIRTEERKSLG